MDWWMQVEIDNFCCTHREWHSKSCSCIVTLCWREIFWDSGQSKFKTVDRDITVFWLITYIQYVCYFQSLQCSFNLKRFQINNSSSIIFFYHLALCLPRDSKSRRGRRRSLGRKRRKTTAEIWEEEDSLRLSWFNKAKRWSAAV